MNKENTMKQTSIKKILIPVLAGLMSLTMLFTLVACDSNEGISVRIENGYIQWQENGSDSWQNLIAVDEIKNSLGTPQDGKSIELRTTETHIQWRYVVVGQGVNAGWKNLYALEDLKDKAPLVDDTISDAEKQQAYKVFTDGLDKFKSVSTKITYDYRNNYKVEYYGTYNIVFGPCMAISIISEDRTSVTIDGETTYSPYTINVVGLVHDARLPGDPKKVPTQTFVSMLKYSQESNKYEFICSGGSIYYDADSYKVSSTFEYMFISMLKEAFPVDNIIDIKSNENGDQIVTFTCNSGSAEYLNKEYIYDFCITSEGKIAKCYVYEKDFLDNSQKGDLFCTINYLKDSHFELDDIMKEVFDEYNKFMVEHDKSDHVYENLDDMFHYEVYIED